MADTALASPPRKILLATDLSCRCDRALDRAASLATAWGAGLVVATIMEPDASVEEQDSAGWRPPPDPLEAARRQIRRDLARGPDDVTIRVEEASSPAPRLLEIAEEEDCGLIVTGIARDGLLERMLLGATVNQLVRHARIPVLMVRNRAGRPYRAITVATDFSEASGHALAVAAAFFPETEITLLHGYEPPFGALGDGEETAERLLEVETGSGPDFLAAAPLDAAVRVRIGLHVRQGTPERVVSDYARDNDIDLTVVCSHGRSRVVQALIGSVTERLLESATTDVLVVMDPHARKR